MGNMRYRIQVGANWVVAVLHRHGRVLEVPMTDRRGDAGEWADHGAAKQAAAMVQQFMGLCPNTVRLWSNYTPADSTQGTEQA